MKNPFLRARKINKGAPSGFIVSIIFHGAIFFIAGLFVVFKVLNPPEPEFEAPPPIERPKMKLKKPKVKVKKSSQPKPSSRIVAKVKTREMPEIQLPDLVGTGEGLLGGSGFGGEFLDLPDIGELNPFGTVVTTGNDLVGRFYDFKRTSDGRKKPISPDDVDPIVYKFFQQDWNLRAFSRYYCAPTKLYTPVICIGTVQSTLAPEAFGENETEGYAWAVVYQGKLVYPEDIKFRFRGVGDKFLGVRVGGKTVLLCIYNHSVREYFSGIWTSHASDNRIYPMGEDKQTVGDWIELKGGVPVDIEIIMGDRHGGLVYLQLAVEVDGVDYPKSEYGGPICPVFKTDNLSRAQIDAMYVDVYPSDCCLTNGPVFCDYFPKPVELNPPLKTNPPPVQIKNVAKEMRTWSSVTGDHLDGKFLLRAEDYILLEKTDGTQQRIPYELLSDEDKNFLELVDPPKFKIEFSKKSDQVQPNTYSPYAGVQRPLSLLDYTFGVKMKWSSSKVYNHDLKVEYFAIGAEVRGNNYILLERKSATFNPAEQERKEFEFYGRKVRLRKYSNRPGWPMRGRKEKGYLIVVTDKDDRVVQYETSNEFLFENIENLKQLPVNAYFDNECKRQFPTRQKDSDRGGQALDAN